MRVVCEETKGDDGQDLGGREGSLASAVGQGELLSGGLGGRSIVGGAVQDAGNYGCRCGEKATGCDE